MSFHFFGFDELLGPFELGKVPGFGVSGASEYGIKSIGSGKAAPRLIFPGYKVVRAGLVSGVGTCLDEILDIGCLDDVVEDQLHLSQQR